MNQKPNSRNVYLIVIVAALGYFVDLYDLILFNVIKKASLNELGFVGEAYAQKEIFLFNMQMIGMLLGGILWGVLGDKKGRISVLFGSIIMYSVANILNGFVGLAGDYAIDAYAVLRFLAGVGLAGELGAGITLVAETMSKENRGWGTMIIVTFGALGAVLAARIGDSFHWTTSYFVGGGMGICLLLLRFGTFESAMFTQMHDSAVKKGNLKMLFLNPELRNLYFRCILIGLPIWFVIGVLINLTGRFVPIIGVSGELTTGQALMYAYIGLSVGDLLSGILSQVFKSRKKIVIAYLFLSIALVAYFLFMRNVSASFYLTVCFLLGVATGYWAIFVTIASEQFGTNLRATVTTTVPNFVRGAVVPITLCFKYISDAQTPIIGAAIVGVICIGLAFYATINIKETFGKDLNCIES